MSWRIARSSRDRINKIAKRSGMSTSELVEHLIKNIDLTDQGIPSWLPELPRDGELPIDVP